MDGPVFLPLKLKTAKLIQLIYYLFFDFYGLLSMLVCPSLLLFCQVWMPIFSLVCFTKLRVEGNELVSKKSFVCIPDSATEHTITRPRTAWHNTSLHQIYSTPPQNFEQPHKSQDTIVKRRPTQHNITKKYTPKLKVTQNNKMQRTRNHPKAIQCTATPLKAIRLSFTHPSMGENLNSIYLHFIEAN